ncbi:hypothetical protein [Tumebacillus flagellatus]|uniref:Uncharacterized protein n=1 Tax=Tumebacillus flagellatus TaxID=1157490 RepID=A0A074LXG7_9BACL|nr:hypothetical protein [Tumebacillus flagellatus]KEO84813.1 hypothetical protein EL26_02035 [Tumebacillus flagellatus]
MSRAEEIEYRLRGPLQKSSPAQKAQPFHLHEESVFFSSIRRESNAAGDTKGTPTTAAGRKYLTGMMQLHPRVFGKKLQGAMAIFTVNLKRILNLKP